MKSLNTAEVTIDISDIAGSAPSIAERIQGQFYAFGADGGVLIVTGDASTIPGAITLDIPGNVTVVWQAKVTNNKTGNAVALIGSGKFLVANGGSIHADTGAINAVGSSVHVEVGDGGTVSASEGNAINASTVTVSGGMVTRSNQGSAIWVSAGGGKITVSGGGISVPNGNAIDLSSRASATIRGGSISCGNSAIIGNRNSGVTIEGNVELSGIVEVPTAVLADGVTLTVPDGKNLTIASGTVFTNKGRIVNNGKIINASTIINNGTIDNHGTFDNHGAIDNSNGTIHSEPDNGIGGEIEGSQPMAFPSDPDPDDANDIAGDDIEPDSSQALSDDATTTAAEPHTDDNDDQHAPIPAPPNSPVDVTQDIAQAAVYYAFSEARLAGTDNANATLRNPGNISHAILSWMAGQASKAWMNLRLMAYSLTLDNQAVDVRIILRPDLANRNLDLSASTTNQRAQETKAYFAKLFKNNMVVVSLGQQVPFGQDVKITAQLSAELSPLDLHFYLFAREANTIQHKLESAYFVDDNRYGVNVSNQADNEVPEELGYKSCLLAWYQNVYR